MSPASDGNYAPADDEGGMASTEASKNDTDPASNQFLNGAGNTMTLFEDTDDLSPANLPDASDIFTASTRTGSTGSAHPLYTPSSAAHTKSSKSILGQEMAKQSMPAMAKRQPSSNDSEKENVS